MSEKPKDQTALQHCVCPTHFLQKMGTNNVTVCQMCPCDFIYMLQNDRNDQNYAVELSLCGHSTGSLSRHLGPL